MRTPRNSTHAAFFVLALGIGPFGAHGAQDGSHFETSDRCVACHNRLSTSSGEDISIGVSWRGSMMANSGRDPYWIASVRRETLDHPSASEDIQDECTICHMPMMRYEAKLTGRKGEAFIHFPPHAGELRRWIPDRRDPRPRPAT